MITKTVQEITINKESGLYQRLVKAERENRYQEIVTKVNQVVEHIKKLCEKNWVQIENKKVYYIVDKHLIMADTTRLECSKSSYDTEFEGYKGRVLIYNEAYELFYNKKNINPLIKNNRIINFGEQANNYRNTVACYKADEENAHSWVCSTGPKGYIYIERDDYSGYRDYSDHGSIKIPVCNAKQGYSPLKLFLEELIPMALSKQEKELFILMQKAYKSKYVLLENEQIKINQKIEQQLLNGKLDTFLGISFKESDLIEHFKTKGLSQLAQDEVTRPLLETDTYRAQIAPYDSKRLTDPNLGHWELWQEDDTQQEGVTVKLHKGLIARNPVADIRWDGVVGIDFGTKSTIVVYQDGDDETAPMRIGCGDFNKKVRKSDYENPTVMEFINLESFLKAYLATEGRPDTLWEDVTISHTASNALDGAKTSDDYYAFFNDLKQWAGDQNRAIRLRDKQGVERVLPAFTSLEEGDFNPIEIYAYYLGLFINNMRNGIYLNYLLSFPVTYEKAVKEKIVKSFEAGIKKSLPLAVLQDEESMAQFEIEQGASEPAAYAICALQEYGFEPEDEEKVFYGIFDFGGGTTDFDFGIWRNANGKNESRFDYVINHFGAGGDQYLGGENLLELLAYEVFKKNQDELIKEGITFFKPTECKAFPGSEGLISTSQEARLNTRRLMEALRPLWEKQEEKLYSNNVLKVMLFDRNGQAKPNFELTVEVEELQKILEDRIEKGVKNFFEALKLTFKSKDIQEMKQITIFLAGNSSKSPIVKSLFDKYIAEKTKEIKGQFAEGSEESYFTIYPPLGSEEALAIQKERGVVIEENDLKRPTGKTGVAYGLVESRQGSRIKVISEQKSTDEVKFKYYLGHASKRQFKVSINREIAYHEWQSFIDASVPKFELYYTNLPEATTNQLAIKQVSKKICRLDGAYDDANVYVRVVAPTKIEYTVATEEGIANNETLSQTWTVDLTSTY